MTGQVTEFPIGLKLKAANPTEKKVLDYITENASPTLIAKINDGIKTIKGALAYAKAEAHKQAEAGASFAMVEDSVVFGWIIHYFEEDSIKEAKNAKPAVRTPGKAKAVKQPAKPVEKPVVASTTPVIRDLFDDFGPDVVAEEEDPF